MDDAGCFWHNPAMARDPIPSWQLYGEASPFPDLLHIEDIADRAAGLDWRIAAHRHLHLHQIFLVRSGQVLLTLDGVESTPAAPCLINMPRGAVHGFHFAAGTDGAVLTLPAADFDDLFGPGAATGAALSQPFVVRADANLVANFAALARLHRGNDGLRRLRLRAATLALACDVAAAAPERGAPGAVDPRMAQFEGLIRDKARLGWQMPDYARALNLSDRHLRRLCRDRTGQSAQRLIDGVRVREACRLLAYTRMPVQAVGFAIGVDDPAYFGRLFRRVTGLAPGAYRARLDRPGQTTV